MTGVLPNPIPRHCLHCEIGWSVQPWESVLCPECGRQSTPGQIPMSICTIVGSDLRSTHFRGSL